MSQKRQYALDTDFLIKLVNEAEEGHKLAVSYYKRLVELDVKMYLSSIVYAEYSVKNDISKLSTEFIPLTFTMRDAAISAKILKIKLNHNGKLSDGSTSRVAMKDDIKICAQIINNNLDGLITAEKKLWDKLYKPVVSDMKKPVACVSIYEPINTHFRLPVSEAKSDQKQMFEG